MLNRGLTVFFLIELCWSIAVVRADVNLDTLIDGIFSKNRTELNQPNINSLPADIFPTKPTIFQQPNIELTGNTFSTEPTRFKQPDIPQINNNNNNNNNNFNLEHNYKSCSGNKLCVPRFLCNGTINTSGENIIDIRIDSTSECSYLEMCCDAPNMVKTPIQPSYVTDVPEGCGHRNPNGVGFRITGASDMEAEFGEFPWVIAILRQQAASKDNLYLYECGGSLIAPNAVLTAAHCVQSKTNINLLARAGEWDSQTATEIIPHQDRKVERIIVHEGFNKGALYNDVALLILESPFVRESNVLPICLAGPETRFDGQRCFAAGWGKNIFGREGAYQVILKKLDLPVVPHDECQRQLRETRLGYLFNLHDSFICAGGELGKDTCKGDGGSPLMCSIPGFPNRFYQAGIVAWGIDCGLKSVPGVYTNVPHMQEWITRQMALNNIDPSYSLFI